MNLDVNKKVCSLKCLKTKKIFFQLDTKYFWSRPKFFALSDSRLLEFEFWIILNYFFFLAFWKNEPVVDWRELEYTRNRNELHFTIYFYQYNIPLLKCLYAADQECFCSGHVNVHEFILFCSKWIYFVFIVFNIFFSYDPCTYSRKKKYNLSSFIQTSTVS